MSILPKCKLIALPKKLRCLVDSDKEKRGKQREINPYTKGEIVVAFIPFEGFLSVN